MKKPEAVFLKQPPARETISCPFRVRAAGATRTLPNGGGNSYVQVYAGHRYFLTVLHRAMQCVRAAFAPRLNALRVSTRSIIAPLAQRSTHWRGIVTNPQHFLLQQLGFTSAQHPEAPRASPAHQRLDTFASRCPSAHQSSDTLCVLIGGRRLVERLSFTKPQVRAFEMCHANRSSNKIQTCLIIGWLCRLLAHAREADFQDVALAGVYACCALDAFGVFDGAATCDQLANGQAHGTGSVTSATGHTRFFAGNAHVKLRKAQDAAHTASTPTQKTASSPNGNEAVELR